MAKVTVRQFADVVGIPVERLLTQLGEAGLSIERAEDEISDREKLQLLRFLRRSHGKGEADIDSGAEEPRKITLKRKTVSEIKVGGAGGRKTVNVEVRKKRTYVKRGAAAEDEQLESRPVAQRGGGRLGSRGVDEPVAEEQVELAEDQQAVVDEPVVSEADRAASEAAAEAARLASIEVARRELEETARREAEVEARRMAEEESRRIAEEEARRVAAAAATAGAPSEPGRRPDVPPKRPDQPGRRGDAAKRGRRSERDDSSDERRGKYGRKELHVAADKRGRRKKGKGTVSGSKVSATGQHGFARPTQPVVRDVSIPETITVAELAQKMAVKAAEVIKTMMKMGSMATINQVIDQDTAILVVEEMGHTARTVTENDLENQLLEDRGQMGEERARPPVVTIMGHVDHGKTSLLDHIRKTRVAAGEAGGITQHIGAYHVDTDRGTISFLDTPGHAAFTAMRARGAQVTDIVVLVVAADDGVMPQTREAIQHSRAAEVPIVVAINKIDKPEADPDRVKTELSSEGVIPEEWGGDIQFVHVSAKSGEGVDALLDSILLQAEVMELTAPFEGLANGVVVESTLDKGRGPVATVLVQSGCLRRGDVILSGQEYGRVRAMFDEAGSPIEEAGPSIPAVILGLSGTPNAGDEVVALADERKAREIALFRQGKFRNVRLAQQQPTKMEDIFAHAASGEKATLNVVVKADVQGSVEALRDALVKLSTDEAEVKIVAAGVGGISESDVNLAAASNAVLFGFNVRADATARKAIVETGVDLHYYGVIYDILDEVRKALTGMLSPEIREEIVGLAEVRDVFHSSRIGSIAGCIVVDGSVKKSNPIRVLRDNVVIYEGELESLRRFKDDVAEVRAGTECGIGVRNYNDVRVGDQIEVYQRVEVQRTL
jgi:translation initiation factor IF-2